MWSWQGFGLEGNQGGGWGWGGGGRGPGRTQQTADKGANWNIAAKWLRARQLERTKRAFPYEGLGANCSIPQRRAALIKAVSGKPWEGWTSTGALPPTGCPCADCVNKDPPRVNRNLGSPSDQYVIQLHAQHKAEMDPYDDQTPSSSSPPPPPSSSSSGKGASALPAVQPLTPEEESDEDQTWGTWTGHSSSSGKGASALPAVQPLTPEEESDEDQTRATWTGHDANTSIDAAIKEWEVQQQETDEKMEETDEEEGEKGLEEWRKLENLKDQIKRIECEEG